ncbi:MAG: Type III restriction enzyme res subunit [Bacillota bacterium]|nr:MAG: Type III restriction enzyme res subunit [Bacillota bacterium]
MTSQEVQSFRTEDLVLGVSNAVDRRIWDESRYEAFLDELCGDREYQKDAIKAAMRYLLGGNYTCLRDLARENYHSNVHLQRRHGTWAAFESQLQLPEQLSATIDLATGTGKSYVLYGLAALMLAEGAVDRVLVLCPSTTIETELLKKFRHLASQSSLRDLLPAGAVIAAPSIINATETIAAGCICVENYHAVLEHVRSSIRDSLANIGSRVLILNDEAHHVANDSQAKIKKWKEFLLDERFGFKYIVGLSGTCYVGNDYFSDVILRYSLRNAIEQRYVKKAAYVTELPATRHTDAKWQMICNKHVEIRSRLRSRGILPLTIIVTATIARCKDVAEELRGFLRENQQLTAEEAEEKVLVVYNNAPDVARLPLVDLSQSTVEWIVSVSMLNEGWDVKRVFQIVPHEERAFNSKLLISQVLGRGLRVPEGWVGDQPEVTVFNHDAWAPRIRQLVNEILEMELRLQVKIVDDSPFSFSIHDITYEIEENVLVREKEGPYNMLEKEYVDLASEAPREDVGIELERATTGERFKWQTSISHKTYTAREMAWTIYERLEEWEGSAGLNAERSGVYTSQFPVERLERIVLNSLARINQQEVTDSMRQRFLQALGTLNRGATEVVRYIPKVRDFGEISTDRRPASSVSASELRSTKTLFYTDTTKASLPGDQLPFYEDVTEPGSGFKVIQVQNRHDFKTPMTGVIADSENEKRFINMLIQPQNVSFYDSWLKSSPQGFYGVDFIWKKRNATKKARFNPDIFIKMGNVIVIVEIKGDEELTEPSEENRKKREYAQAHFDRINDILEAREALTRYKLVFLTERNFGQFFQSLRQGNLMAYRSELDVVLTGDL